MPRPAFIDIITEAKKSTYEEIESGFATDLANIYLEFKGKKKEEGCIVTEDAKT